MLLIFFFIFYSVEAAIATLGANVICNNMLGLVNKQVDICQKRPDVMVSISEGAEAALNECQYQFRKNRWNCSLPENSTSLQLGNNLKTGTC